ncbi:glucosamine-6-phosphate deaminase [Fredinandcohnia quinoae]|uniref:Glucosamine-6-phosphate deaminase n=1 Tax=Fredinandcohnia quinoae TaxID=2918902 RepID=A0AAW5E8K3_9BACI|nr:glucosamine-6-phosphate deaminase [Fredinandcohnia sp. SECRCQ15]MCH1627274.1 glucosamine-6-phosphate deaminase [Fredinandcohnia sp. SECRCQ15]
MKLIMAKDYQEMSNKAADVIINQVKEKPNTVLGLATGGTVIGMYEALIQDHQKNNTSYKEVHSVNLDEYVGLEYTNQQSYHYYMNDQLFSHIDIQADNVIIPNGLAENIDAACQEYEKAIAELGGVDLQILGIGQNGHIAFNEPGTSFDSITHKVELTESTRNANMRYFDSIDEVPTHAMTMGISTILKSKQILLLASGKSKAEAIYNFINGEVHESNPASALKNHPNVTIIADEEALSLVEDDKKKVLS